MQGGAWIGLLHQIPKSQHDNLVLTTVAGTEIVVQAVHRIEAEYLLVRGRQTGVTDVGGGYFFIPYDRILLMGFQRPVKEAAIRAIYGEQGTAEPKRNQSPEPEQDPEPSEVAEPAAAEPAPLATPAASPEAPTATAPAEPPKATMANKAELLERLRARRGEPGPASARP